MRLLRISLATAAVLALTGTALANTRDERTVKMGGTAQVRAGGTLQMAISRKPSGKYFHVVVQWHVTIKSKTRLAFSAYPCKSTSCAKRGTTQRTTPYIGSQKNTYKARVPVIKNASGQECVFLQIRDEGPNGKRPGTIVRRHGHPGTLVCHG
jgi:hypothetical protein